MAKSHEQEPKPIPIPDTPGWRLTKAIHAFLDPGFTVRRDPEDGRGPWGMFAENPLLPFPSIVARHLPKWEQGQYYYEQVEEIAAKQHPRLDIPDPREAYLPEIYGSLSINAARVGFARTLDFDMIDPAGNIRFGMQTSAVTYNTYYYPDAPGDALFSVGRQIITQSGAIGPVTEGREVLVPDTSSEAEQVAQYLEDHMNAYFANKTSTNHIA